MSIVLDGTGTISGVVAGGLPDATITQAEIASNVAGTGPAFSAYQSSSQSVSATTFTKVTFDSEVFDTNSNFASSTFTPTVAGYYQINSGVSVLTATTRLIVAVYKNGTTYSVGNDLNSSAYATSVSSLIYCNGSTDYLDIYVYCAGASSLNAASSRTWFNGALVRAA